MYHHIRSTEHISHAALQPSGSVLAVQLRPNPFVLATPSYCVSLLDWGPDRHPWGSVRLPFARTTSTVASPGSCGASRGLVWFRCRAPRSGRCKVTCGGQLRASEPRSRPGCRTGTGTGVTRGQRREPAARLTAQLSAVSTRGRHRRRPARAARYFARVRAARARHGGPLSAGQRRAVRGRGGAGPEAAATERSYSSLDGDELSSELQLDRSFVSSC